MTFEVVDPARGNRQFLVDAWYPVDPEDAQGDFTVYEILLWGLPSELALDSPPVSHGGRFPLVIFSHGSGGIRFQSIFLTELLASHGFVVVAPDHTGNTLLDDSEGELTVQKMIDRPLDVSLVITEMLAGNEDPADPFYQALDAARIGVTGHSFGGFTSFAMAAGFGADPPSKIAGELPEDFEPIPPDSRVKAIVAIAPVSSFFGDSELSSIRAPTLIIGGTQDTTTPIEPESRQAFELIPGEVFRVDVVGAVHFSFTNSCDLIRIVEESGFPEWLVAFLLGPDFLAPCGSDVIDVEEAQRLTNLYAVSHFKRFVMGDERYERFLSASYTEQNEPDVLFFAGGD
jgi:predicted dienelactone hydrolase